MSKIADNLESVASYLGHDAGEDEIASIYAAIAALAAAEDENVRLREALAYIVDLDSRLSDLEDAQRIATRALSLAKEAGQPHSAWPTGPGYRKGDTCQSADGTIWRCVEADVHSAKWERGKAKEAGE